MPRSSEIVWPLVRHGDVFEHGLAPVAEARRFHGRNLQAPAQLVNDERGESLTLDLLSNDEQRLAGLHR